MHFHSLSSEELLLFTSSPGALLPLRCRGQGLRNTSAALLHVLAHAIMYLLRSCFSVLPPSFRGPFTGCPRWSPGNWVPRNLQGDLQWNLLKRALLSRLVRGTIDGKTPYLRSECCKIVSVILKKKESQFEDKDITKFIIKECLHLAKMCQ